MERKLGIAIVILGLAAFSPAPINQAKGPRHFHPEQSQAEVAKQQVFNGVQPVVGQVPLVTDEVGGVRTSKKHIIHEDEAGNSIAMGTEHADKVAGSITQATNQVAAEEHSGKFAWIFGLLIIAAGYLGWKGFQYKVEKSMPVPEFSKRFLKDFEGGNS